MDPLRNAAPRAIVKPVVPDAVETPAEDFFRKPEPGPAPEPGDIAVAPEDIAPGPHPDARYAGPECGCPCCGRAGV